MSNTGKGFVLVVAAVAAVATLSGCASYRTTSNVSTDTMTRQDAGKTIVISESSMLERKHSVISPIEVSIKKLTVFHPDPTKEQANDALTERARAIGADAVIGVTYKSGVGFTTWGYMDANGVGVKFEN